MQNVPDQPNVPSTNVNIKVKVPTSIAIPNTKKKSAHISYNSPEEGQSFVVCWSPGNRTRYRLMFTPLSGHIVNAAGFDFEGARGYLVTWVIPGEPSCAYIFSNRSKGHLHYSYVQEKLCQWRGSFVDASELTRIIGQILKRPVTLATDETGHETQSHGAPEPDTEDED